MSYRTTQQFIYNRTFAGTVLGAFTTRPAAALIATATVVLLKAGAPIISPDTLLADLTPFNADFSGYANATPTLSGVVRASDQVEAKIGHSDFVAVTATPFVPNSVVGYYVTDGTALVGGEIFGADGPVEIANVGDFVALDLVLPEMLYQESA